MTSKKSSLYGFFFQGHGGTHRFYLGPLFLSISAHGSGGISSPLGWRSLPQWHHRTLVSSSVRTLRCLAMEPTRPVPSIGQCSVLAFACPHPQGCSRVQGWCCPWCPWCPLVCPVPGWGVRTSPATLGEPPWPLAPGNCQPPQHLDISGFIPQTS